MNTDSKKIKAFQLKYHCWTHPQGLNLTISNIEKKTLIIGLTVHFGFSRFDAFS